MGPFKVEYILLSIYLIQVVFAIPPKISNANNAQIKFTTFVNQNDIEQAFRNICYINSENKNPVSNGYAAPDGNDLTDICSTLVGVSKGPYCPISNSNGCNSNLPKNCKDVLNRGNTRSGIYEILPVGHTTPIQVLCEMDLKNGGWLHIQKRFDGSEDFYRNWRDYKHGFGNLRGEFWLGLENIHSLTGSETNELLIELTDHNLLNYYAAYSVFIVGSEYDGYILTVESYNGNATADCQHWRGQKFTTFDLDNDRWNEGNCANYSLGGWWYNNCYCSNLNGKYRNMPHTYAIKRQGLNWDRITESAGGFLYGSRMLIRPKL